MRPEAPRGAPGEIWGGPRKSRGAPAEKSRTRQEAAAGFGPEIKILPPVPSFLFDP